MPLIKSFKTTIKQILVNSNLYANSNEIIRRKKKISQEKTLALLQAQHWQKRSIIKIKKILSMCLYFYWVTGIVNIGKN